MKLIRTEDAVGSVLCHDLTQIIKGVTKDAVFRKGHVVQPEDIPVLLSIGKEHLYVWEADESMLHENDAARILCDICKNTMMDESPVKEGKIELAAAADGLFKVDGTRLRLVNSFGQMMIATRHGNTPVKKGEKLCGTRIIPLVIEKEKCSVCASCAVMNRCCSFCRIKSKRLPYWQPAARFSTDALRILLRPCWRKSWPSST